MLYIYIYVYRERVIYYVLVELYIYIYIYSNIVSAVKLGIIISISIIISSIDTNDHINVIVCQTALGWRPTVAAGAPFCGFLACGVALSPRSPQAKHL